MITDGVIRLRPPVANDRDALLALRDEQLVRFMGNDPQVEPTFCITVDSRVVGWVDFDRDERDWLDHTQVNIGYALHPDARGRGCATRAVMLLVHHLALTTDVRTATLLIDPDNGASLAMPRRCGFTEAGTVGDHGARLFTRAIPRLTYTDGVVTLRPVEPGDLERDLEARDEVQIAWAWSPEQRAEWVAMTPQEQREHVLRELTKNRDDFGRGPKWCLALDGPDAPFVAALTCDLASRTAPHGESNIGYIAHPAHRGKGYVSRGVRLAVQFLTEHTGAREAHISVAADNEASLRVARSVAREVERWTDERGRVGVRHVIELTR